LMPHANGRIAARGGDSAGVAALANPRPMRPDDSEQTNRSRQVRSALTATLLGIRWTRQVPRGFRSGRNPGANHGQHDLHFHRRDSPGHGLGPSCTRAWFRFASASRLMFRPWFPVSWQRGFPSWLRTDGTRISMTRGWPFRCHSSRCSRFSRGVQGRRPIRTGDFRRASRVASTDSLASGITDSTHGLRVRPAGDRRTRARYRGWETRRQFRTGNADLDMMDGRRIR